MYYIYNMWSLPHKEIGEYYTETEINKITIKEWPEYDPKSDEPWPLPDNGNECWWPVYKFNDFSTNPGNFANIEEAKQAILENCNQNLYEKYNNC